MKKWIDAEPELFIQFFKSFLPFYPEATWLADEFEWLCDQYSDEGRYYHTLDHIRHAFATLDEFYPDCPTPIKIAVWYHDVVYDATRHDNEEQSAKVVEDRLFITGVINPITCEMVSRSILMTAGHDLATTNPFDYPMLVADLAGLGGPLHVYRSNGTKVKREYMMFSEAEWRLGRVAFLEGFLGRPRIFPREERFDQMERWARTNMELELRSTKLAINEGVRHGTGS